MSKYIRQLRYYKENDERNYPQNEKEGFISLNNLANPFFFSQYMPVTQLGIQTLPGTKFYLNDNTQRYPIIVGYTGIYELDLSGIAEINSIVFDIDSLNTIQKMQDGYLIIDMVCEGGAK